MRDYAWPFWPILPLYPYGQRRTLRHEIITDTLWTFDQLQGILYVVVPVRMTVVRLQAGGLLVYAPIAPTPECIRLVKELVAVHGEVKYIILPTVTGLEHKVFVGPFARQFAQAQVFVAPQQWSFPLNLPLSWLGLPAARTYVLPENSALTPFSNDFDYQILAPLNLRIGTFSEVAFFHMRSQTLLVTDAVVSVPADPPAILQLDPYPLLFHAKDSAADTPTDTAFNRRKGWQRIALFAFYFRPSALIDPDWGTVLRQLGQAADRSKRAYFGLFPFRWQPDWQRSFEYLRGNGRLFVAPVLQTLIFHQNPAAVVAWVQAISQWPIQRIIPCHLDAPIVANGADLRQAFAFLESPPGLPSTRGGNLPNVDFKLLEQIRASLTKVGIMAPPPIP